MKAVYSFVRSLYAGSKLPESESSSIPPIALCRYRYVANKRRIVFHSRYVFGRLLSGSLRYQYNGYENEMMPGVLYLFRPDSLLVEASGTDGCEIEYFHFDERAIAWILAGLGMDAQELSPFHEFPFDPDVFECLEDLSSVMRFRAQGPELKTEILISLMDLLVEKIRSGEVRPFFFEAPNVDLLKMKLALLEHCEPLDPEINQGSPYLCDFGAQPTEVQAAVHAERARDLLEGGVSVLEIAKMLRLSCVETLGEVFHKSWMLEPQAYQNLVHAKIH